MAEIGIEKVYETAAKLLETEIVTLQKQIFTNFARVFYSTQNLQNNAKPDN